MVETIRKSRQTGRQAKWKIQRAIITLKLPKHGMGFFSVLFIDLGSDME